MATEMIVVCSCDLCGERRPEADMHMDVGWTWDGQRYVFDADEDCFSTVETLSITELIFKSRADRSTRVNERAAKRRARRLTSVPTSPNGQRPKQRRFETAEYARHYRSGKTWQCPACDYTSSAKGNLTLATHFRKTHGGSLWQDLEQRINAELVGGKREPVTTGR